jgi:hypothetical protein
MSIVYQKLYKFQGIEKADGRGSAIDHVTARRMALWLLPRSGEEPDFMRGPISDGTTQQCPMPSFSVQHWVRTLGGHDRLHLRLWPAGGLIAAAP